MRRFLVLPLLLAGGALSAQGLTWGLYTGASLPIGDLKDKTNYGTNQMLGAHVGGLLNIALPLPKQSIRAHLSLQILPGSAWGGLSNPQHSYEVFQGGADWMFHFQQVGTGWYVHAGATINNIKDKWEYTVTGGPNAGVRLTGNNNQSGKFGLRGGGGYYFSPTFSVEGTLNQVSGERFSPWNDPAGGFGSVNWVQASAVWRFGR